MTTYNTGSDAANTAVRAYLTKVGEIYLGRTFNTASGKGKDDWNRICNSVFQSRCAYCDNSNTGLQIEHLVMFNREEYGLHHPGNIVPLCKDCNKRQKHPGGKYFTWEEQLLQICKNKNEEPNFASRKKKILDHIENEKHPKFTDVEKHAIRVVAEKLYDSIKNQVDDAVKLYKELDQSFVKSNNR